MSAEALKMGAATARQLAMDVFNPSHSALEIEERLNALANALEDAARRLPPQGGTTPTNRGGCKTAEIGFEAARMEACRAEKALQFAKHTEEMAEALRRPMDPQSSVDLHRDLRACVRATVELLEGGGVRHKYTRVGGLGYCGRKDRGGCAAVDTLDDGSVYCMDRQGCLPIKTDWRIYD